MLSLFQMLIYDNEKLRMTLDYLASFKDDVSKAVVDEKCFEYLAELHLVSFSPVIEMIDLNIYIEKEAYSLFASYLAYFASICEEMDFKAFYKKQHKTELNEKRTLIFFVIVRILNSITTRSPLFNLKFNQTCGLKALLAFIESEKCIKELAESENDNSDLLALILADLNWLSKCSEENKQNWSNIKAADILLNGVKYANKKNIFAIIYMIVTNIVDDKQIENDSAIHKCADLLIQYFQSGTDRLNKGVCIPLDKEFYIDNVISKQQVNCYMIERSYQTLVGILQALYRLAINETMRYQIYGSENFKQHILVYFSKGKPFEVRCILSLLAQISFTPKLAMALSKDEKIMESISKIINNESNESDDELHLKQICKNIKWNIETNQSQEKLGTEVVPKPPLKESADVEKSRHVMISYNTASRDLCIRLKQQLESFGFKIWIDVSDIHGSSLAAMANAVEMSYCVLMCVTEKYRTSINCQAEAQYAFKLNKPIIPLIMQQGYENVTGWLGIIIGDKIFINFMKYEFDECLRRLKNELENYVKDSTTTTTTTNSNVEQHLKVDVSPQTARLVAAPKTIEETSRKNAEDWDDTTVSKWFTDNRINEEIQKSLQPCNGEILKQMYDMKCRAPEFYYQSLSKIGAHDLISITRFSASLDKLFK